MKYRKLGKTDLLISEISLGCSGYWGNKNFSESLAEKIVVEAFEKGVNFFDTGHNYSNFYAEPRLGRIIKKILQTNDRSKLVISTKGGTTVGSSNPLNRQKVTKDFSPEGIEKSIHKSIENLNCGYLDIFQLHGISASEITEPLMQRLESLKQKQLIRYIGANVHVETDMQFIAKHPDVFDMVLIDYNVLQLDRNPIIDTLSAAGIGVVAGTVLAQGHILKGQIGSVKTGSFFWYLLRTLLKSTTRELKNNSGIMRETLASVSEMTAAQAAFSYILENKAIVSCVFGTTNPENLHEIIEVSGKTLSDKSKSAIFESFSKMPNRISK